MAYPAYVIAYAFVRKGIEEGRLVTQMKVQKLVFFAHGYHLARYGQPLVLEQFEAWKYGPVIPSIYKAFKFFGSKPITDYDLHRYAPGDLELYTLDSMAQDAIEYTWEVTKDMTAEDLSSWAHQKGSPWYAVYNPYEKSTKIKDSIIRSYFEDLIIVKN